VVLVEAKKKKKQEFGIECLILVILGKVKGTANLSTFRFGRIYFFSSPLQWC